MWSLSTWVMMSSSNRRSFSGSGPRRASNRLVRASKEYAGPPSIRTRCIRLAVPYSSQRQSPWLAGSISIVSTCQFPSLGVERSESPIRIAIGGQGEHHGISVQQKLPPHVEHHVAERHVLPPGLLDKRGNEAGSNRRRM